MRSFRVQSRLSSQNAKALDAPASDMECGQQGRSTPIAARKKSQR
jgi:hypothetical protein